MTTDDKPKLVLDLDDTVCDFMGPAARIAYLETGRLMTPAELHLRWLNDPGVFTQDELERIRKRIFCRNFYMSLMPREPLPELHAAFDALSKHFDIKWITARGEAVWDASARLTTLDWLAMWGLPTLNLEVVRPGDDKTDWFGPNTFGIVEDNLKHATATAAKDMWAFVIAQTWNNSRFEHPNRMVRVNSFCDAARVAIRRVKEQVTKVKTVTQFQFHSVSIVPPGQGHPFVWGACDVALAGTGVLDVDPENKG